MSVEVKETSGCRKILEISLPAEDVKKEYDNAIKEYKSQAAIPGFRKGKATTKVIEQKFGADIIKEIEQSLTSKAYHSSIKEADIKVAMIVEIKDSECSLENGLKFTTIVDVEPEFKMPKYEKISLKPNVSQVKDDEVENIYERIIESRGSYNKVEDRPAKKDDFMRVSFSGTLDGKPLADLGEDVKRISDRENFWILPEMKDVVPGLDDAVVGMKIEDEKDVSINFPKDYAIGSVAGKTVEYKVTLTDLQEKVLPEINEELLKSLQVESVDELKEKIREDIQNRNESQDSSRLIQEVADYLDKHTKMELPESVVIMETRQRIQQTVQSFMQQGQKEDEISEKQEEILKSCEKEAKKAVKLSYILTQVAIDKAIEVTDEEVENLIYQMAMQNRMTPDAYKKEVLKDNTENVKENILCNKALAAIKDEALAK